MPVFPTELLSDNSCPCCDSTTNVAKGTVQTEEGPETDYWVRWTEKHPENPMLFVVTDPQSERPVASLYSIELGSFMIVGPNNEFVDLEALDQPFSREEIIGTPLAKQIFAYLDEIFLNDHAVSNFISTPCKPEKRSATTRLIGFAIAVAVAVAIVVLYLILR